MIDKRNGMLKEKKLAWVEKISIGKGIIYVLEEEFENSEDNSNKRIAGWVKPNGVGKFESGIPGLPSEAIFNSDINRDNSAIKLGDHDDVKNAKAAVENHIPDESEWIFL